MTLPSLRRSVSLFIVVAFMAGCASGNEEGRLPQQPSVTADDIERSGDKPIETVIQAKVPGAIVTRTSDGGIALQIRGASSVVGEDNAPLFVIDDMPFEPGPGGLLTGVDPYNIDTIKVLKGADGALYGMRGFNGVVVITLKKPGRK